MGPEEIREKLSVRPFQPLRVHLSDGASFDIRHPEMVLVARRELHIGIAEKPELGIADRTMYVNILHITRIEPIGGSGRKSPRRRSA